jgi:ankyrin repeat protein
MIRQSIFAISILLLSQAACSVDEMHKEFPSNFELMSDQVAEGTLNVPINEIFILGTVQVGKLADAAGRGDTKEMQRLVSQGVLVNGVGQRAMTPLLWALGKRNMTGFVWLLEHGADPNLVSCCDTKRPKLSPMAMAAQGNDPRFLEVLLNHGGDSNLIVDDVGRTPIFYAVTLRRIRNIELLIQHHADLNRVTQSDITVMAFGDTVLQQAIDSSQFEIALMLLRAGADPCIKNRSGHTVVGGMVGRGNSGSTSEDREAFPQIIEYLKRHTCG